MTSTVKTGGRKGPSAARIEGRRTDAARDRGSTGRSAWLPVVAFATALLLAAIVLSPLLRSGFLGDDAFNSTGIGRSTLRMEHVTLAKAIYDGQLPWIHQGRFFPVSALTAVPLYLADGQASWFKVYILGMVLLDLGLFGYFVRQATGSWGIGVLAIVVMPLLFQFRSASFHDPILGFSGLLPMVAAWMLISLIAILAYMRTGKRRDLAVSLVAYAAGLLSYEITIPLFLLHMAIAWLYPKRHPFTKSLRISWPFAALSAGAVAVAVGLRLYFGAALTTTTAHYVAQSAAAGDQTAGAYALNLALGPAFVTAAKQIVASLPLSYQLLEASAAQSGLFQGFGYALSANPAVNSAIAIGYGGLLAFIAWESWIENAERRSAASRWLLPILGVGLLVLPNVLIALSARYQGEVFWGVGYLPVYVSYFGVALLVVAGVGGAFSWARPLPWAKIVFAASAVALAGMAVGVAVLDYQNNALDVEYVNRQYLYPRDVNAAAIERGVFQDLPVGARLIVGTQPRSWANKLFFESHTGKRLAVVSCGDPTPSLPSGATSSTAGDGATTYQLAGRDVYFLDDWIPWADNGAVILGVVDQLTIGPDKTVSVVLSTSRVYVSAVPLSASEPVLPSRPFGAGVTAPTLDAVGLDPSKFTEVTSGSEWGLFKAKTGYKLALRAGS
jgi:hypothetical protein